MEPVTATYNSLTANGTIIVTSCGDNSRVTIGATFKEDFNAKIRVGNAFGVTVIRSYNTFSPTFNVCLDSAANLWRVRITGLAYLSYDMYVQEEGWNSPPRKDIASATDQDINTENVCAVITDLTPDYRNDPPRKVYWCRPNTQIHENYHLYNQWINQYIGFDWSRIGGIEDTLEGEINYPYIQGSVDTPEKAHAILIPKVNKKFNEMYEAAWGSYDSGVKSGSLEMDADENIAYAYTNLVNDIKNTWPMTLNAPTLLSVNISGTTATLYWSDNSCNEDNFIAFAITMVGDVGIPRESEVPANSTSATITNLFSGTWSFGVVVKRGNQSFISNIINATVP